MELTGNGGLADRGLGIKSRLVLELVDKERGVPVPAKFPASDGATLFVFSRRPAAAA